MRRTCRLRRMVRALGSRVEKLVRVSIGSLELGSLPAGRWRELERDEVRTLSGARKR